ncbi:MAG: hypothetical protein QM765_00250 [Myxococcales bacterium]
MNNGGCDGNDTKLLEEYGTCLGKIAKCETGREQEFADAESTCYASLSALSDGCATGLSMVCTTSTNQAYSLVDAYDNLTSLAGKCTVYADAEAPGHEEAVARLAALQHLLTSEPCLRGIESCTHQDLDAIEAYTLCLEDMTKCVDGSEEAFEATAEKCFTDMTLSAKCLEAIQVKPASAAP